MVEYHDKLYSMQAKGDTSSQNDEIAMFESIPVGYRFAPTDQELVENYLMKKVNNEPYSPNIIHDVNLYSEDLDQLTAQYKPITENTWYFFTPRNKKYPNGQRPARATPRGYWKPTGVDKAIIPEGRELPRGSKKTLDFYQGEHPVGTKTDWKMHEYRLKAYTINSQINSRPKDDMTLDNWVLCRIYRKGKIKESNSGTPSPSVEAAQNNEAFLMSGDNYKNPNASQPTVNVSQNDGALLMAAGHSIIGFQNQYSNAFEPTANVAQYNEASLMAGNDEFEFEDQNFGCMSDNEWEFPTVSLGQPIRPNQMNDQCDTRKDSDPSALDGKK